MAAADPDEVAKALHGAGKKWDTDRHGLEHRLILIAGQGKNKRPPFFLSF